MSHAFSVLRYRDFTVYAAARFCTSLAWGMLGVAVGWQVYQLTRNPLYLGLVGLAQFLPFVLLVLPADHVLLIHQVPAGTEIKMVAIYDEPFWRHDGVSGATVATDDDIEVTLDTCQPGYAQGVIAGYCAGPLARRLAGLSPSERQANFVKMLTTRIGEKAAAPLEVMELNWAEEDRKSVV